MYCEAVSQYIEDGHARPIDEEDRKAEKITYLPYHGVFREDRATTKCRVLFDSSAKTYDGQSLNSCLKDPKLQPDPGHVLMRFMIVAYGAIGSVSWQTSRKCFFRSSSNTKIRTVTDSCGEICIPIENWKFIA